MIFEHDDSLENNVHIKVIGVGGGGNNAVNRMISNKVSGVEFFCINTDRQALQKSKATTTLLIGEKISNGYGAGANPKIGAKAAEESVEDIRKILEGADMVFITAGMGGGTGSGAVPVVARIARELDILTVGIVTKPFAFEGKKRMDQANQSIAELAQYLDSLIVIPNEKLKIFTKDKLTLFNAFSIADNVLLYGVQSICDLINNTGLINLDFADITSIMANAGYAHMGIGIATGKDKAIQAAKEAIASPLLETSIQGAKGILMNITVSPDVSLEDADLASTIVAQEAHADANIIWGLTIDSELENTIKITIIATGFEKKESKNIKTSQRTETKEAPPQNIKKREIITIQKSVPTANEKNTLPSRKSSANFSCTESEEIDDILDMFIKR